MTFWVTLNALKDVTRRYNCLLFSILPFVFFFFYSVLHPHASFRHCTFENAHWVRLIPLSFCSYIPCPCSHSSYSFHCAMGLREEPRSELKTAYYGGRHEKDRVARNEARKRSRARRKRNTSCLLIFRICEVSAFERAAMNIFRTFCANIEDLF